MHQKKNRLKCGEPSRRIEINKSEDMRRISYHLVRIADFRYIAVNTRIRLMHIRYGYLQSFKELILLGAYQISSF